MKVRIFTDGACSENPGPGGWAAVFNASEGYSVMSGNELCTTNNRMELMAVVMAMKCVLFGSVEGIDVVPKDKIEVHSDSAYVTNAINDKWMKKWALNGWKTAKGKDVKNRDLWEEIMNLLAEFKNRKLEIKFVKVKGHNGNTFNEIADENAKKEVIKAKNSLAKRH